MTYNHYLKAWGIKLERLSKNDKEELKILYHGLKQLTEEERSILMDKYLKTEGRPHPDKVLAERYGLTDYQYRIKRCGIESKLHDIVGPMFKELSDKRLKEILERNRPILI